jgi:hypothetical protein
MESAKGDYEGCIEDARIDYRAGVLIASLASNLGWTLDKRIAEVQCCLYR